MKKQLAGIIIGSIVTLGFVGAYIEHGLIGIIILLIGLIIAFGMNVLIIFLLDDN